MHTHARARHVKRRRFTEAVLARAEAVVRGEPQPLEESPVAFGAGVLEAAHEHQRAVEGAVMRALAEMIDARK